ncbi:MAG: thiol:disulfide interchange protein DsbA/DsbL [Proteobacteria bacterium]|nr:MAG: thiol:disulfide interchange protein DsbA/DsbL [Pseudomonadota bacterium]
MQTGNRVEVLEIFWYHCPHCYAMEPIIEKWIAKRKPDYVELRRLPGVFRRETEFDARVYFAAAQMGIVERIHSGVYQEIHVRRNRFRSLDDLDFLLGRNDIDPQAFAKAFHSNQVDARMKYAETMYEKYEASGVPTIIVDGRYRTTASAAGGYEALMDVTEFLVKKAASERGSLRVSR